MNITDLVTAKHQLEADLLSLIHSRVQEFTALTGVSPDGISVDTARHEIIGMAGVECRIVKVSIGIKL